MEFDETGGDFEFTDKSIRHGFIRKVFMILMAQLAVTTAIICIFTFVDSVKDFFNENVTYLWVSLGVLVASMILLMILVEFRRRSPINFIMLAVFTLLESFCLGTLASKFDTQAVAIALAACAFVCFAIMLFAFQTKIDFTPLIGIMFVVLVVFVIFGFVMLILSLLDINYEWAMVGYASVGVLVFSIYLVIDTQIIINGKAKYAISPEEYIFAALNLYLDFVNIFVYLLYIIGICSD